MKAVNTLFFCYITALIFLNCQSDKGDGNYIFSYFKGNGEDGLHLAISEDGYNWDALNDGQPVVPPLVGESCLMRDPCITTGPDGTFHMVWTTSWSGNTIGYASSSDLLDWSVQKAIPVMAHEDSVMNCWAPEINYNPEKGNFIIYWSSTITTRFQETANSTKNGNRRNHRIYYTTTEDFENFSETKLLYEPGINVIDASIYPDGDRFAMFIKNETELPKAEKNISVVFADNIEGPYSTSLEPFTGDYWAEGPSAIKIAGKWHVYFDKYRKHEFGQLTSFDLVNWTDESADLKMPEGIRHGTIVQVSAEQAAKLKKSRVDLPVLYRDIDRRGRPYAKDPSVAKFKGTYYMYYTIPRGLTQEENWLKIGIANSKDLDNWEKVGELLPEEDYERNGFAAPCAKVIEGQLHLFYQVYGEGPKDAIAHAVSDDGIHFERNETNPIFAPTGDWNIGRAIDADVFIEGEDAYLYWATRDPEFKQQMLGVSVAKVADGFKRQSWKQLSEKPLLKPELPWEISCIEAATVFKQNDTFYMFYAGAYNHEGQQIGLAMSKDAVHWERTSTEPVLPKGAANEWNSSESGHPGVFIDEDGTKWLFYQGNPDNRYTYYLSKLKFEITADHRVIFDQ